MLLNTKQFYVIISLELFFLAFCILNTKYQVISFSVQELPLRYSQSLFLAFRETKV